MFYVTIRRDTQTRSLLGPFPDSDTASRWVEPARAAATATDSDAGFDKFEVLEIAGRTTPGLLNDQVGYRREQYELGALPRDVDTETCGDGTPIRLSFQIRAF